jgi:hypothetical protein
MTDPSSVFPSLARKCLKPTPLIKLSCAHVREELLIDRHIHETLKKTIKNCERLIMTCTDMNTGFFFWGGG